MCQLVIISHAQCKSVAKIVFPLISLKPSSLHPPTHIFSLVTHKQGPDRKVKNHSWRLSAFLTSVEADSPGSQNLMQKQSFFSWRFRSARSEFGKKTFAGSCGASVLRCWTPKIKVFFDKRGENRCQREDTTDKMICYHMPHKSTSSLL